MSNTDLVQIWNDTFTLVYRQNVERMGYEDACKYAKYAANLHVNALKLKADDFNLFKVRVQIENSSSPNSYYFHFDKQYSDTLIQYLKDNVQGITYCDYCIDPYKLLVVRASLFDHVSFLNNIKTAIEMFFRKYRMGVEYVKKS
jgi:hypothetical protein